LKTVVSLFVAIVVMGCLLVGHLFQTFNAFDSLGDLGYHRSEVLVH
jgi:hypothetical protein